MSLLDVSELMTDPDFVDQVILVNRIAVVNSYGENILQEQPTQTVGSVQPASGEVISRLPQSLQMAEVNSFWIKGKIVASEPGKYSAVIIWHGQRYQVQTVQDWSSWGAGYCEGTCVAEGVTG